MDGLLSRKKYNVVDLFCGAGGLSLGFRRAGFSVIHAIDTWIPAVESYRANLSDHIEDAPITQETELPACDVIVGGPPCQGFSSAGTRRSNDERNSLVSVFAQIVAQYKPAAFVFENVEGFLTVKSGRFLFELLDPLVRSGYRVHIRKLNAANYGVPQHRKRVVAIGGLGWDPPFPTPTHNAYGAPGAHLAGRRLPPTPSVADALEGLPEVSNESLGNGLGFGHDTWPLNDGNKERAKLLKPGQCMRDLPSRLWHPSYRRRAFRRVKDGTPTEHRGGAPAGLRRLRFDEPSKTITGGATNEFLHPEEHRCLTIRECARIQTFPDEFRFAGTRRDRIQLIGNGVPPLLATLLATCLLRGLEQRSMDERKGGALLSFVPTLSTGTSPILADVISKVSTEYGIDANSTQKRFPWV